MSFSNVDFGGMKQDLGLKLSSCLWPQGRSLLKLSIDSLYPEKSGSTFCIISMVKSCQSYIMCRLTRLYAANVLQLETNFSR